MTMGLTVAALAVALVALVLVAGAHGRMTRLVRRVGAARTADLVADTGHGPAADPADEPPVRAVRPVELVTPVHLEVAALRAELAATRADLSAVRSETVDARADIARSLRNVAVVRFDAPGDPGGASSFSAALVDDAGDGIVITALQSRTESRAYAKAVAGGESDLPLTPEEHEALEAARTGRTARVAR